MEHVKAKTTRILPVVVFPLIRSSAQFCILEEKKKRKYKDDRFLVINKSSQRFSSWSNPNGVSKP